MPEPSSRATTPSAASTPQPVRQSNRLRDRSRSASVLPYVAAPSTKDRPLKAAVRTSNKDATATDAIVEEPSLTSRREFSISLSISMSCARL